MNIFARFEAIVATAARELVAEGRIAAPLSEAQLSALAAERPRDASHGDIATNAALVLASDVWPRVVAARDAGRTDELIALWHELDGVPRLG